MIKIDLNSIKRLVKRRFLLRHIVSCVILNNYFLQYIFLIKGLEIYSNKDAINPHIYLAFRNQTERDNLYKQLLQEPAFKLQELEQDVMTLQWQNGIISNYDYLLYINR